MHLHACGTLFRLHWHVQKNFFLGESFRRAQKLLVAVVFDDDENGEEKAGKRKGEKGGGGWAR